MTRRRKLVLGGIGAALLLAVVFVQDPGREQVIKSFADCAVAGYPVTDSNPPACSVGKHTYLGPKVLDADTSAELKSVPFELLVTGDSLGTYPAKHELITNQADWLAYWHRVHSGLATVPPLIYVDFSKSNVIALSSGPKTTNGYNLKVSSISTSAAGTIVDVVESVPTVTCNVKNVRSDRYFIAMTSKLTAPVSFRLSTDYHRCTN